MAAVGGVVFATIFPSLTPSPLEEARMAWGELLVWVGLVGGGLTARRYPVANALRAELGSWVLRFLTASLALLALHTGFRLGLAATASHLHLTTELLVAGTVAVLLVVWTSFLAAFRTSPAAVALQFGAQAAVVELVLRGPQSAWQVPLWILAYGVLCWVPARSVRDRPSARPPSALHHALTATLPLGLVAVAWTWT